MKKLLSIFTMLSLFAGSSLVVSAGRKQGATKKRPAVVDSKSGMPKPGGFGGEKYHNPNDLNSLQEVLVWLGKHSKGRVCTAIVKTAGVEAGDNQIIVTCIDKLGKGVVNF